MIFLPAIGFVHTVHRVIEPLSALARELFGDLDQLHYLDESTLRDAIAIGGLSEDITRRVCDLVLLAAERSDLVLITCSSIGPCADTAQRMTTTPVLRIDEPMAEEAVSVGERIAVVATLGSTLGPTADLIEACALRAGKGVQVERVLCSGAFEAASRGCGEEHDEIVLSHLRPLARTGGPADVIVLAQASMARVAEMLGPDAQVPILSSPRSGIARAGHVLRAGEGRACRSS